VFADLDRRVGDGGTEPNGTPTDPLTPGPGRLAAGDRELNPEEPLEVRGKPVNDVQCAPASRQQVIFS